MIRMPPRMLFLPLMLLGAATLTGCLNQGEPYEVSKAGNQTFLLNKKTGEVKLIEGTTLVAVDLPDVPASSAASARLWPDQQPSGVPGATVSIRTKYRDGQMHYIVSAGPYDGPLGKAHTSSNHVAALILSFVDTDGFAVAAGIDLKLSEVSLVVNNEGNPDQLRWSGSKPMSAEAYAAAATVVLSWRGFPSVARQ